MGLPPTHMYSTNAHTHSHTQSQSKLSTTVLIEQNVFQFSGEIKGGKREGVSLLAVMGRGGRGRAHGGLNVILNDLRSTDSNV